VLAALDPRYGLSYLFGHGLTGLMVLGGVFLCATGAEALYADMGHFGRQPIKFAWYGLVLPTLLLNYAGQAAAIIEGTVASGANPFFVLCPASWQLPLVALATAATVIASQAIISGTFSMTRQAIQLGLCPRLHITQTSSEGYGQIYVGFVNWALMVVTLGLAITFRSSDNLASAFGVAVALTMLLTSLLILLAMRELWKWSAPVSITVGALFIMVDFVFVTANLMKVLEGGWVPLLIGAILFYVMSTWYRGRAALARELERDTLPLKEFIAQVHMKPRVAGTAIYMTSRLDVVPVPLLHNLKHNKVLHQRIVLLHVVTENIPRVPADKRVEIAHLGQDFHTVVANYGFMQNPNVPRVLQRCGSQGLEFNLMDTSFFVGRVKIVPKSRSRFGTISCKLFEILHRNALAATEFFRIPSNRVIELGGQVEI
jgi:KUP system potassium uptake protein